MGAHKKNSDEAGGPEIPGISALEEADSRKFERRVTACIIKSGCEAVGCTQNRRGSSC